MIFATTILKNTDSKSKKNEKKLPIMLIPLVINKNTNT